MTLSVDQQEVVLSAGRLEGVLSSTILVYVLHNKISMLVFLAVSMLLTFSSVSCSNESTVLQALQVPISQFGFSSRQYRVRECGVLLRFCSMGGGDYFAGHPM